MERVGTPGAKVYQGSPNRMEQVESENGEPDQQGPDGMELVELSNVDLGQEIPQLSLNATMYKANLKTLQTTDEMFGTLLDLKA